MDQARLVFLGAGNIATAIISGLLKQGFAANRITAVDPRPSQLELFKRFKVNTSSNNIAAVKDASVVILSVKPAVVSSVALSIAPAIVEAPPLVISVAAGVTTASLSGWLGSAVPVIRCMPNTPAKVQLGTTGMFASPSVSSEQKQLAAEIMGAVGLCLWMDTDAQLDAVTALSGSGPAYFFYFMELMQAAGVELGLDPETCRQLVEQTALGAATMAIESSVDVSELRRQVTSPGGTTEAAINRMQDEDLPATIGSAINAAYQRSIELSHQTQ